MYLSPLFKKYPKTDPNEPNWRRPVLVLLVLVFTLSLLPFIYTGTFSRYHADDYCFSSSLIQHGYFGSMIESYQSCSNRFSTYLVIGLIDELDVFGMQILPGLLITGMMGGLYLLFWNIKKRAQWPIDHTQVLILTAMTTFFTIYTAPDQFQSFYWRSGSITYTLPVVLLPFLLALIIKFEVWKAGKTIFLINWVLIYLLSLFNGGFSETTVVFQLAIFGFLLVFAGRVSLPDKRKLFILLLSAMAGILTAMIIMILAPGNDVRLENMPDSLGVFRLIYLAFRFAAGFIYNTIKVSPLPVAVSCFLAFALAFLGNWHVNALHGGKWVFMALPVAAYLLIVAICAPSAYAQSAYPEARALLPARWIITIAEISFFYMLGIWYQGWRLRNPKYEIKKAQTFTALLVVFLCFYPMRGALSTLGGVPEYQSRAVAWDNRSAIIVQEKAAGNLVLTVQELDSFGRIRELSDNPELWVNKCAAVYYGVQSITAK